MKSAIFVLVSFFSLNSCTTLVDGENSISEGSVNIVGGRKGGESWDDPLYLRRYSWYRQADLDAEIILGKIEQKSPFTKWLSPRDKSYLTSCSPLIISFNYSYGDSYNKKTQILEQFKSQGFREIALPWFKSEVEAHPIYIKRQLNRYGFVALCGKSSAPSKVLITLPGYHSQEIVF